MVATGLLIGRRWRWLGIVHTRGVQTTCRCRLSLSKAYHLRLACPRPRLAKEIFCWQSLMLALDEPDIVDARTICSDKLASSGLPFLRFRSAQTSFPRQAQMKSQDRDASTRHLHAHPFIHMYEAVDDFMTTITIATSLQPYRPT